MIDVDAVMQLAEQRVRERLRTAGATLLVLALAAPAHAQLAVVDPGLLVQQSLVSRLRTSILSVLTTQATLIRQWAARLTGLGRYAADPVPAWSTARAFATTPDTVNLMYAFDLGDLGADAYSGDVAEAIARLSRPRTTDAEAALACLDQARAAVLRERLAALDVRDATLVSGTTQTGRVREKRGWETLAISGLQSDATNEDPMVGTTQRLDALSGGALIGAGQAQARVDLWSALVEQLAVESRAARNTDAAAMNQRLQPAPANLAAGTSEALAGWRQP